MIEPTPFRALRWPHNTETHHEISPEGPPSYQVVLPALVDVMTVFGQRLLSSSHSVAFRASSTSGDGRHVMHHC